MLTTCAWNDTQTAYLFLLHIQIPLKNILTKYFYSLTYEF